MSAHVDMFLLEPVRSCNPTSGDFTLLIPVAYQWEV
ncbi:hypothetical protein SLEP1_g23442 [Rubroshorea leprosula]|uniref:Uncharacterized protein n=1 Tax=Rubroshorea leprosula TaxID=152421 RepID=A0AAV5JIK8_9ROSI|nr:hypothetical protein SLEP1_g23442 [Rubroshorea leprosula]